MAEEQEHLGSYRSPTEHENDGCQPTDEEQEHDGRRPRRTQEQYQVELACRWNTTKEQEQDQA